MNGLAMGAQSGGEIGAVLGAVGGFLGGLLNSKPIYHYYNECEKEREKTL